VVKGVADALGWDFVEVLASSFLSEGMDSVPKSADGIFQKLMELDHCVILFDEIDELIRVRDDDGSDPFGRFLTTSMLPKLAKLWEQRRVLFFVATNDIEAADPAIKRSQRFDAAIFVPPPSFGKKRERLSKLVDEVPAELTEEAVESALNGDDSAKEYLGVFAFLRWDQIDDLANRIKLSEREDFSQGDSMPLERALVELGEELDRTDWKRSKENQGEGLGGKGASEPPEENDRPFRQMFERWDTQRRNERRDFRRKAVLQLENELSEHRPEGWKQYRKSEGYVVFDADVAAALRTGKNGALELDGGTWQAEDGLGIFSFRRM
jgi:SpoVK/Ycf46/Vps4 family AAA+-type ATPase